LGLLSKKRRFTYPTPDSNIVSGIIGNLSTAEPRANLEHLSAFRMRYCRSDTGKASSEWLLHTADNYATLARPGRRLASEEQKLLISVEPFHHSWPQTSVVRQRHAVDSDPITIIGAHCDSVNIHNPYLPAPGADDDGSGTVTAMEAFRGSL
ncbi:hypothetical protein C8J57DRAFT_977663, partial [Mycena rebaudengoi]